MLVQEPPDTEARRPTGHSRPRSGAILLLLTLAAATVLVLRHDYWFWDTPYPLLFGFLPVGLWWQGLVSLLAAGLMALMVRFAWPGELEEFGEGTEARRHGVREEGKGGQ